MRLRMTIPALAVVLALSIPAAAASASAASTGGPGPGQGHGGTVLRPGPPQSVGLDPAPIRAAVQAIHDLEVVPETGYPLFPGAVAVMGHQGRVVAKDASGFARLYADADTLLPRREQIPMRRDTIFDLASLSKLFTSIAAVQLVERGRLQLDAPVAQYLPDFAVNGKQAVTVRQLLTHTSGFTSWLPLWSKYPDAPARLQAVRDAPLINAPGTAYLYSDLNMISLAMVIETITGKGLDEVVREQITAPLKMRDTMYNPPARLRPRIAATEFQTAPDRGLVWGEVHDENAWALGGVAGHAGVFSTADDLSVLAQTLLNGGEYGRHRILTQASVQLLITDLNQAFPGHAHGLGFEIDQPGYMGRLAGPQTVGHTGYTGTTIVIDFSTSSFAILLTNRVHPSRNGASIQAARAAWASALADAR